MEYKNIFQFNTNYRSITMLMVLAVLPNFLGMLNMPTIFGFKIHTFQYLVFVAAAIYGPIGGGISGGVGSMFSAFAMGNPYIVFGNIILGFAAGYLFRNGWNLVAAAMTAFAIQVPWLYLTDVYLVNMPHSLVMKIIVGLLMTNLIWSTLARFTYKPIKQVTE